MTDEMTGQAVSSGTRTVFVVYDGGIDEATDGKVAAIAARHEAAWVGSGTAFEGSIPRDIELEVSPGRVGGLVTELHRELGHGARVRVMEQ